MYEKQLRVRGFLGLRRYKSGENILRRKLEKILHNKIQRPGRNVQSWVSWQNKHEKWYGPETKYTIDNRESWENITQETKTYNS